MILRVIERGDPLRSEIENYVRQVFARQHAALVREFPDRLAAVLAPDRSPLCAAGFRTAEDGFFSEYYLDAPIEAALARNCGMPVERSQVIEVTSLASDRPGHCFLLLDYITQLGRADGRRWGVFTATEKLRRRLERTGLTVATLAPACAEAVPNRQDWGRYYEAKPTVCAMWDCSWRPISFLTPHSPPAMPELESLLLKESKALD